MSHTFTISTRDHNTSEQNNALHKISKACMHIFTKTYVENSEQPYEVYHAESSLSLEANKIASVIEQLALF